MEYIATRVDEAKLVEGLRAGSDEAFEELVRGYGGRMLAVARRFMRNDEDARDAVQDAFLSAFRSMQRFEGGSKLGTWLHRIVANACLMKLRTKRRKPETSIEDLLPAYKEDGHQLDPRPRWEGTAQELLEQAEARDIVRAAIDELPDGYRNVLLLRDIEGIGTDEAARMLSVSAGAVKTRLHRARQALKTQLEPHFAP